MSGKVLRLFLLTIFLFLLYWNGIHGNFVWDDRGYFIDNDILPHLKPWQFKEIFLQPSNFWFESLPLRDFLYVLEYNLFGLNTLWYHIVSIGLYVLTCFVAYLFLCRFYLSILDEYTLFGLKSNEVSAFFVTLIFAAYPVHAESVAYISGQKDLLFSLFALASVYTAFMFFDSSNSKKSLFVISIMFYYMALLSKLMAIALVVVIPTLYILSDSSKRPKFWKAFGGWIAVNIPAVLWILKNIQLTAIYYGSTSAMYDLPFVGRVIRALKILGAHIFLAFKPYPLSFGYPFDTSMSFDTNLLIGISTVIIIVFLIFCKRKDYTIILGSCFFILFLLPVLQFHGSLDNASVYDRYLFIPVLGIAILMERFLRLLPLALNYLKIVYISLICGVVLVFSIITISYIPAFRNDIASTKNTYEKFPDWSSAAFNYVYSLIEGGKLNEAYVITSKEKTFSSPFWVRGYFKGWILLEKGLLDDAISELMISSMLASGGGYFPYPNIPLAKALIKQGRQSEAIDLLDKALSSPIYQPLEVYKAKKLLEEVTSKGKNQ